MTTESQAVLLLMARLLDYPDESLCARDWFYEFITDTISSPDLKEEAMELVNRFCGMPLKEVQEHYVEIFDYTEEANLYLTSHELGDSRKRGAALIQLQRLIMESGFDHAGKELADYIPMLLELMAVMPEHKGFVFLKNRLDFAIRRIYQNLPESSVYRSAAGLLLRSVFGGDGTDDTFRMDNLREKADLDELPYPLLYQ